MANPESVDVAEIAIALHDLGGEASAAEIKDRVTAERGGVPPHYKDERSFRETIQRIIEDHCPQSANFRRKPLFERVEHGRYRLIRVAAARPS